MPIKNLNEFIPFVADEWAGMLQVNLPHDINTAPTSDSNYEIIEFPIDLISVQQFKQQNFEISVAFKQILLLAFQIMLFRNSDQYDIGFGIYVDGSILPLHVHLEGEMVLNDAHVALEENLQKSFNFRDISGSIVGLVNCLFLFDQLNESFDGTRFNDFKFDLVFGFFEKDGNFFGRFFYETNSLSRHVVTSMAGHYLKITNSIVAGDNVKIGAIPILSEEESNALLKFNDTVEFYPQEKTIHQLFEEQVFKTPDNIALYLYDFTLTYSELNKIANRLARLLIKKGLQIGENVAIMTGRNFNMIIGMYGILKAGGTYIPVDPDYPLDRQNYILSNSAISLVITDQDYADDLNISGIEYLNLNSLPLDDFQDDNLLIPVKSTQLAYCIYTSGSTGRPKAVMIEHHSVVNLVLWVNNTFNVCTEDRLLFITSMCFDLSVYDIFGMLATGGALVIANQHQINNFNELQLMFKKYKITFWDSVPSTLDYLIRELEVGSLDFSQNNLRIVLLSGDWIPVQLSERVKVYFPNARVISLGGATEATVWSNFYPVETIDKSWKSIPYGTPITNNFFYILNEQLQPVPRGVTGHLFIGGVGVAKGYVNNPEGTNKAFISDPFNQRCGGVMYRTGDQGRFLPNMNMEFIGRVDNQVKIRGYRVELGEIESTLAQNSTVSQAVVLVKTDSDSKKYLVGYIVPNGAFDKDSLINHLKAKLPDYMVPLIWIEVEKLPLNINGKIDRNALNAMTLPESILEPYQEAETLDEKIMTEIWQQVLSIDNIGINDNFYEIGGHSLMALQIVSRFETATGKRLTPVTLFRNPTIALLSMAVKNKTYDSKWKSLIPIKATGNKNPLYIVHGNGLYAVGFSELAKNVDVEQPVFGLQPKEVNDADNKIKTLADIAKLYLAEVLENNPTGPYLLAGYSFGGFVAVEMERQLTAMGKDVKMLAIFDTNAENSIYNKPIKSILWRKIFRQFPKILWGAKSMVLENVPFFKFHYHYYIKAIRKQLGKVAPTELTETENLHRQILEENLNYYEAWRSYVLDPVTTKIHLFKAKRQYNYADDFKYLGWKKIAKGGLELYDVPGDHNSILQNPNVLEFGRILQSAIDKCAE
ncbi:amino acid adenylation domain-containing protein [Mucilaginibacter pineti]|uniref:Amino acid adenylation domain-containing protein n=1 Tax=Mucilaginibacter pineti TaxID=1391627 RepID=A0A1G6ZFS9_9SPHI|nr:amino acid adenylation domain-containing protein [Mucilaginibacter pineti]SDE01311.1 amino acid adenylation domain-containing protein [Mucilaginibacter pineti]